MGIRIVETEKGVEILKVGDSQSSFGDSDMGGVYNGSGEIGSYEKSKESGSKSGSMSSPIKNILKKGKSKKLKKFVKPV